MTSDKIMTNFKTSILKSKILPCMSDDIDLIIKNRAEWEIIQIRLQYIYEFLLLGAFIAVYFKSQIVMSILIGSVGCCNRIISHSERQQLVLTNKLNGYLKHLGITDLIPEISDDAKEENEEKGDTMV